MNIKESLRVLFRQQRQQLTPASLQQLNQGLLQQVDQLDLSGVAYCHLFLPIQKFNEPDTFLWMQRLHLRYPRIQFVTSRSHPESGSLTHFCYTPGDPLEVSSWGIPEPLLTAPAISEAVIDFVFVPLLVCDRWGNRIGYGKGFYDRFLASCRPDVRTMGVSVFEPLETLIPAEGHDMPLGGCISPTRLYYFTPKD